MMQSRKKINVAQKRKIQKVERENRGAMKMKVMKKRRSVSVYTAAFRAKIKLFEHFSHS